MLLFAVIIAFIVIGILLTWFLLANDPGEKEPVPALWVALGFGVLGAVIAYMIEKLLIPASAIGAGTISGTVLASSFGVGLIEESCKFLPLGLFIYKRRYFTEYTDGVIYFTLAGLGFGIPENILYSVQFGSKIGFSRMILTPIFHACTTSLVGYFLIKAKIEKRSILTVLGALIGAIILHGFYDFGLSSGNEALTMLSFTITIGMTLCFFLLYLKASDLDLKNFRPQVAVAPSNFCKNCGTQNTGHKAYCTKCGRPL